MPCVNDEAHGVTTRYYETGELMEELPYIRNKLDGKVCSYYKSGILKEAIQYKKDLRHGISK